MSARATPEVSAEHLHERIAIAHDRVAALATGPARPLRPGPDDWDAATTVAHLVNVTNRYNQFSPERLAADPRGVDRINEQELAPLLDRGVDELLDALADELATFRTAWGPDRGLPLDTPIPFHGGATIDLECGLANLLAELLIHGLDLARLAGEAWPIDETDALAIWRLATQVLPFYARAGIDPMLIRFDVEHATPWTFAVDGGIVTSRPAAPDDEPDVTLRTPALPLVLWCYRRHDFSAATRAGLAVIGGQRVELAAGFADRFEAP